MLKPIVEVTEQSTTSPLFIAPSPSSSCLGYSILRISVCSQREPWLPQPLELLPQRFLWDEYQRRDFEPQNKPSAFLLSGLRACSSCWPECFPPDCPWLGSLLCFRCCPSPPAISPCPSSSSLFPSHSEMYLVVTPCLPGFPHHLLCFVRRGTFCSLLNLLRPSIVPAPWKSVLKGQKNTCAFSLLLRCHRKDLAAVTERMSHLFTYNFSGILDTGDGIWWNNCNIVL